MSSQQQRIVISQPKYVSQHVFQVYYAPYSDPTFFRPLTDFLVPSNVGGINWDCFQASNFGEVGHLASRKYTDRSREPHVLLRIYVCDAMQKHLCHEDYLTYV